MIKEKHQSLLENCIWIFLKMFWIFFWNFRKLDLKFSEKLSDDLKMLWIFFWIFNFFSWIFFSETEKFKIIFQMIWKCSEFSDFFSEIIFSEKFKTIKFRKKLHFSKIKQISERIFRIFYKKTVLKFSEKS